MTGRDPFQYTIAGVLLAIGVLLWFVTVASTSARKCGPDGSHLEGLKGSGPVN